MAGRAPPRRSQLIYLLARLHEFATEAVEQLLDLRFRRAEHELLAVGEAIERAGSVDEIDRALVEEPVRVLRLASAAVFREQESGEFRRSASAGWDARDLAVLPQRHSLLGRRFSPCPYRVDIATPPEGPVCPRTSRGRCSLRQSLPRGAASRSCSIAGT